MNSFASKFSNSATESAYNRDDVLEDTKISDAMWGSSGGFGNLTKYGPTFDLPAVPDVCNLLNCISVNYGITYLC